MDTGVSSPFYLFSEQRKHRLSLKTGWPNMYRTGTFSGTHFHLKIAFFLLQNKPPKGFGFSLVIGDDLIYKIISFRKTSIA